MRKGNPSVSKLDLLGERGRLESDQDNLLARRLSMQAGTNPDLLFQVGINPSIRIQVGINPSLRIQVGINPNLLIRVGINPNLLIRVGTNTNLRIQVGINPNLLIRCRRVPRLSMDTSNPRGKINIPRIKITNNRRPTRIKIINSLQVSMVTNGELGERTSTNRPVLGITLMDKILMDRVLLDLVHPDRALLDLAHLDKASGGNQQLDGILALPHIRDKCPSTRSYHF